MEAALESVGGEGSFAPREIGSGRELSREELLEAPLLWPRPELLDAPLTALRGAGPRLAEAGAELGLESVGDVLRHLPRAYRDAVEVIGIGELRTGEEATVLVRVRGARLQRTRRRGFTILEAEVADETGAAKAVWFNRAWLADRLAAGTWVLLRGKLEKRGFTVAQHELLGAEAEGELKDEPVGGWQLAVGRPSPGLPGERAPVGLHTTGVVAMHPASEALRAQRLREWAWQSTGLARHAAEPLPAALRCELGLAPAADALVASHLPADSRQAEEARRRLAFEELFLYQVALAERRQARLRKGRGISLEPAGEAVSGWLASLPFELTGDQKRAIAEIDADLGSEVPMQRLLMGEVGSGKTVLALFAMLRAVEAGWQAALMAPTETLAEQHFATLERLLGGASIDVALLSSSTPGLERAEALARLAGGELGLVVGTHALIEPSVEFAGLAVAVVDEQHRFGVRQRQALDGKGAGGATPHLLHMTATPIPRTLSVTAYGDLDVTSLHELPAGRPPVRTWAAAEESRPGAYEFIRERLREGRQAYVVCPLVSGSEALQAKAATEEGRRLASGELREFSVEVLHGQMPAAAKAEAMRRFASGEADVLVATSVIEVGIDVANATVMVVEGAERYGLSQLHQLRGRVGRGRHESYCVLFSAPESEAARARIEAICSQADGFRLAEVDLSIRGEGELLGTRQHGLPRFRAATLPEDGALLLEARRRVRDLLDERGSLEHPALGPLAWEARRRFGDQRLAA